MKKLSAGFGFIVLYLILVTFALGADLVPVVPPVVALPAPTASFILWAKENLAAILGVCLALSELMGASPWFKGNGLIDSVTKSLKFLMQRQNV